jgi:hypothetical protein
VKQERNGKRGWRWREEVLFNDTPEGKRAKWRYIKARPDIHAVVMACYKHFGKLADVKVYRERDKGV